MVLFFFVLGLFCFGIVLVGFNLGFGFVLNGYVFKLRVI